MVKVLVADGNTENRNFVKNMLDKEGYEVLIASSGKEALEKANANNPGLILMDVNIPQIDGFETTKRIKEVRRDAIVIMMGSSHEADTAENAIKAGAVNYLIKPLDETQLKNSLLSWAMQIEAGSFGNINLLVTELNEKRMEALDSFLNKKGYSIKSIKAKSDASGASDETIDLLVLRADTIGDEALDMLGKFRKDRPELPAILIAADSRSADTLSNKAAKYGRPKLLPRYFDDSAFILIAQYMISEYKNKTKTRQEAVPSDYIFVVDDETESCKYIEEYLVQHGYRVWCTSDPRIVLDQVKNLKPAIVLLDIVMPGISGIELLKNIRKMNPETQVIMMTAVKDEDVCRECIEAGAADFIIKPFSLEQIKATILATAIKAHIPK